MRLDFDFGIKSLHGVNGVFVYKETYSDFKDSLHYSDVELVDSADGINLKTYLVDGVRWIDSGRGACHPMKEDAIIKEIIPTNDTILFASVDDFLLAAEDHVSSLFRDVY